MRSYPHLSKEARARSGRKGAAVPPGSEAQGCPVCPSQPTLCPRHHGQARPGAGRLAPLHVAAPPTVTLQSWPDPTWLHADHIAGAGGQSHYGQPATPAWCQARHTALHPGPDFEAFLQVGYLGSCSPRPLYVMATAGTLPVAEGLGCF